MDEIGWAYYTCGRVQKCVKICVAILRNANNKILKKSGFGMLGLPNRNDVKILIESRTDVLYYKLRRIYVITRSDVLSASLRKCAWFVIKRSEFTPHCDKRVNEQLKLNKLF